MNQDLSSAVFDIVDLLAESALKPYPLELSQDIERLKLQAQNLISRRDECLSTQS